MGQMARPAGLSDAEWSLATQILSDRRLGRTSFAAGKIAKIRNHRSRPEVSAAEIDRCFL